MDVTRAGRLLAAPHWGVRSACLKMRLSKVWERKKDRGSLRLVNTWLRTVETVARMRFGPEGLLRSALGPATWVPSQSGSVPGTRASGLSSLPSPGVGSADPVWERVGWAQRGAQVRGREISGAMAGWGRFGGWSGR